MSGEPPRGERGIALVSVLWTVALLSMLAAAVVSLGRTEAQAARNAAARAEARALAEAGAWMGVMGLLDRAADPAWRVDGTVRRLRFEGSDLAVSIQAEAGKVDLNAAGDDLLAALIEAAGVPLDEAMRLVDRIADWRDADDLRRLRGAEAADYRAAGRPGGPADAPFERVEELGEVLGLGADLLRRLRPAVTVHSGRRDVDPETAPRSVLLALPGMDPERADAFLAARRAAPPGASWAEDGRSGVVATPAAQRRQAFAIRAEAKAGGASYAREVVVRLTENPARPYVVLEWRD